MSVRRWSYIANSRVRRRAHPLLMVCVDAVEGCLEVVEDDGVAEALEDEGELGREGCCGAANYTNDTACVDNDEQGRDTHRSQHDAESRADGDQLDDAEAVPAFDRVEQRAGCEYPPRVTLMRLAQCSVLLGRPILKTTGIGTGTAGLGVITNRKNGSIGRVTSNTRLILLKYAKLA
ncbi:conserved hypothetical protein [Aspergillus fumigatus A1163]|uniref:Uncharacterized protein n=1 Tax=Aspergillus fumigatus (strain CBS 144.89 / FGSC A1163 / CEA10) TaxID=451804 RepID=B0Y8N1_ASPFC|nr:conserved hypothetical protein [Aspergillus fumigatus A1163]